MILDTSFIVSILRNKERFIEKKELDERGVKQKISSMTIMEFYTKELLYQRGLKKRETGGQKYSNPKT
ncbi:MAG: hypothetical protein ABEJ95_06315 [Candidatus Nanohalobium sp.]